MNTATTRPPAAQRPDHRRSPLVVRVAAVLIALLNVASTTGLVLFSTVWNDDPIGTSLVFAATALAATATVLAALPALLRGDRLGWLVCLGWTLVYDYWTVYKVFGEPEPESWPFLVVGLSALALLVSPRTRTHVGAEEL